MKIYIDESGTFKKANDKGYSISCVGTLVIPDWSSKRLFKKYEALRRSLPKIKTGEVKGRLLNEQHVATVIDLLRRNNVLFEAILIDMNLQDSDELTEQINQLKENHTHKLSPVALEKNSDWINSLLAKLDSMSSQLFVQMMLATRLIERTIQHSTAYYSQRAPKELGGIEWHVDAKSKNGITSAESWWRETIGPFLASRSHSSPSGQIPYGDYSHYDAAYGALADDGAMGHDLSKVFYDLHFSSKIDYGLELVDILTNALRRALMGNLKEEGWQGLPDLVIRTSEESFQFILFSDASDFTRDNVPYFSVYKKLRHGRKAMLSRSSSKLAEAELAG